MVKSLFSLEYLGKGEEGLGIHLIEFRFHFHPNCRKRNKNKLFNIHPAADQYNLNATIKLE